MSFPRYTDYMDSGVEWLGEVPGHWGVKKIGHVADLIAGFAFPSDRFGFDPVTGIPLVRGDNVTEGWLRWGEKGRYWPHGFEYDVRYLLAPNDILVQMDGSKVGKNWALVGVSDLPALLVQRVTRIRANGALPKFVYSFIANEMFIRYVDRAKTDPAIPHITMKDIADYWITLPPLSEQTQIAAFLDHETVKIDALVAEQRRLMELLKEKRQAVISHAVTRGLNPDAPMKPSGIEWLGDVPEHWELKRLKYLGEAITGLTYSPSDVVEDDTTGTLVLRSSNVQRGVITFNDNVYVSATIPDELVTQVGDILICSRNGSRALIGKNATIDETSSCLTFGAFMTVFRSQHSAYLSCVLNSPLFEFQSGAFMTSTINQLTIGVLNNFEVPFPPENERADIADFLVTESAKFDTLTTEAQRAIDLLQERRTALISAAVTGQIDVRSAYRY